MNLTARQLLVTWHPAAYATQVRSWFNWCEQHHLEPLADVRRPHVELYARDLEARGLAPATIALKLVVITGFYCYCVEEQLLEHSPAVHVRRPKVSHESTRLGLDRTELGAFPRPCLRSQRNSWEGRPRPS